MSDLKICVYAICKNEEKFVDAWMHSMSEADLVVVTDTGSTDSTVEQLEKAGAIVYTDIISPWRFDVARNISLAHVPDDVDVCVCTDLDELFVPGWRKHLESAWNNHQPNHEGTIAKTGRYLYNWSLKEDGSPDIQFYYFKVHERQNFCWKCPVHEYVEYIGTAPLELVYIDGMILNHYPDAAKSRSSYLSLLELAVQEAPDGSRMRYYLGREYFYTGQWQKCIDALQAYLDLPASLWKEERSAAMRYMAQSYRWLFKIQEAYNYYFRAIAEAPHMRDAYVEFAKLAYFQKDWSLTLFLAKEALKIKEKSKTFINMGYAWDYTLDDLLAVAAYHLGLLDLSYEHAKKALALAPNNERLQENIRIIEVAKGS